MFLAMSSNATKTRKWSDADIPDQSGRVVIVTGANTGLGYHTAAALAFHGAHVVLAVRNLEKGKAALARIVAAQAGGPKPDVTLQELDLTSLDAVRAAAAELRKAYPRIDLLINNAGVMWTPKEVTKDGFELQFGTNHLGHFALTGLLLDHLLPVPGSRVVTVSSLGHRIRAAIHFDDLQWERSYQRIAAYGQSKLANLLFTYELQRRLAALKKAPENAEPKEASTIAVAAHPGGSNTSLARNVPRILRPLNALAPLLFQSAESGAWPTLRAATDPFVEGGQYYGPDGFAEQRGHPKLVKSSAQSHDEDLQRRLWTVSEELTGVNFPV
jgi:NAD(P)-dependent dehydrogenase (short-subunit alcohol dehydrogenase family)